VNGSSLSEVHVVQRDVAVEVGAILMIETEIGMRSQDADWSFWEHRGKEASRKASPL
jgi:hypothetical protein